VYRRVPETLIRETLPSNFICRSPSSIITNENGDAPGGERRAVALFRLF
jgi:hypothetical protein